VRDVDKGHGHPPEAWMNLTWTVTTGFPSRKHRDVARGWLGTIETVHPPPCEEPFTHAWA